MACVLVPAAEAIVTTIATKIVKSRENNHEKLDVKYNHECENAHTSKIKLSQKLGWLNKMLWGGSAILAFEHIWHGEIVPFFPFLTNAATPASLAEMLHEIVTTGVGMAALVTACWGVLVAFTSLVEKKNEEPETNEA